MNVKIRRAIEQLRGMSANSCNPEMHIFFEEGLPDEALQAILRCLLENRIDEITTENAIVDCLLRLIWEIVNSEKESAGIEAADAGSIIEYITDFLKRKEFANRHLKVVGLIIRGDLYRSTGNFALSQNDFRNALRMIADNSEGGFCRNLIKCSFGDCVIGKSDIDFYERNTWSWWLFVLLQILIGNVHYHQKDYRKAYEYYCIAARLLTKHNRYRRKNEMKPLTGWILFFCFSLKGKALIELGKATEALRWLFKAIREMLVVENKLSPKPGYTKRISCLSVCISHFEEMRYEERINRLELWALLETNIGDPLEFFGRGNEDDHSRWKSDYLNKVSYCLNILSVSEYDELRLKWIEASILLNQKNLYAHFDKLLYFCLSDNANINDSIGTVRVIENLLVDSSKKWPPDRIVAIKAFICYMKSLIDNDAEIAGVRGEVFANLMRNFDNIITAPFKFYKNILKERVVKKSSKNVVVVMRRWNSFTPRVPRPSSEKALGGGYFIVYDGRGIVVDPGFDFIDNLYMSGYSINDIDAVFITHSHIDHCDDFDAMLTLFIERNSYYRDIEAISLGEINNCSKKIDIFLNDGSMKKYSWLKPFGDDVGCIHLLSLTSGQESNVIELPDYSMKVEVVHADHKDFISEKSSVGLKFHLGGASGADTRILAFSGDTQCYAGMEQRYEDADLLFLHIGDYNFYELSSVIGNNAVAKEFLRKAFDKLELKEICQVAINLGIKGREFIMPSRDISELRKDKKAIAKQNRLVDLVRDINSYTDKAERANVIKEYITDTLFNVDGVTPKFNKNHLGFNGVHKIVYHLARLADDKNRLVVLSEHPEELGSFRHIISKCVMKDLEKQGLGNLTCLTGDIGMEITIEGNFVKCSKCAEDNSLMLTEGCFHSAGDIQETCIKSEQMKMVYLCKQHKAVNSTTDKEYIVYTDFLFDIG